MADKEKKSTMKGFATNDQAYYYSGITSITVNEKNAYERKGKFLDDLHNNAFSGEIFRIETNLFDYETPLCEKFKEFNYLLKIDPDVLTNDIVGFKNYDEYKDDWIYEWNKNVPWVHKKPWTEAGVWTEPTPIMHCCKPFNYKNGCSEWPTCSWREDGYCNGGNLPGAYLVGDTLSYQDLEWYDALKDSELKEEALRNKAIMEGLINEDVESNDEDTDSDILYAVSIKEDMAYSCLHFTRNHEELKIYMPYHFWVPSLPFNYPTRRLTIEEMLAKFIDEGKCEHKEMEIFIKEFRTTNELLLKERSNLLSELEIKNEPPRFEQDVQKKPHDDGVENKSSSIPEKTTQPLVKPQQSSIPFPNRLFARFGVPKALISDRGIHFCNSQLEKALQIYGVTHKLSTTYHPQSNGQTKVTNRSIKRILKRSVGYNPKDWSKKLNDALWAFRTAYKTPTSESRLMQLNELAYLRDGAYENTRIFKERTKKWHDSRLRGDKDFKVGYKVLLYNSRLKMYPGKLKSKWSGPNIVKMVYPHGAIEITNRDRVSFKVNRQRLKKYYEDNIDKEDDEVIEFENGVT
ncbi:reverse transcriptase domain-containing protein [Tanacetum coccineum]